jgi:ATP synthase protein I
MNKTDRRQIFTMLAIVSNIGFQLAAAVFVGFLGGQAVDKWLHIYPLGTFSGVIFGAITGMWSIYRRVVDKL